MRSQSETRRRQPGRTQQPGPGGSGRAARASRSIAWTPTIHYPAPRLAPPTLPQDSHVKAALARRIPA